MEAASTSASATSGAISNHEALNDLMNNLKCSQCKRFPTNAHICPKCSEMFCYTCICAWLSNARNKCAKCNAQISPGILIKLRCFENLDSNSIGMARLSLADNNHTNSPQEGSEATDSEIDEEEEWIEIVPGRKEPVDNLPKAVEGTFTLRNFRGCRAPWIFSERVVDEMGFSWRLRVAPKKPHRRKRVIQILVELLSGEDGHYEIMLELLNIVPRAIICKTFVRYDYYAGPDAFLSNHELPRGDFDLKFRYTIRPADFHAKVQIQQRLLDKRAKRLQQMKGKFFTFEYCVHAEDLHDDNIREFMDPDDNEWHFGVHRAHANAEFQLRLHCGFTGIYEVQLTMTHSIEDYDKVIRYEREFDMNRRNVFNFQIRWDQLKEHGFTHGYQNYVKIRVAIRPVQLDLKFVQDCIGPNDIEEYTSSSD